MKIASGLGQTVKRNSSELEAGEENAEDGGHNDEDEGRKKKRKRLRKSSTVERNLKNINLSKFELEFEVDPLFKKTSSQFDGASGGKDQYAKKNILLN